MPTTTCTRHPGEETRLACSACGDPVCHRCVVATPVGQKCPRCARQAHGARARGKPRQLVKAGAAGIAAAAAGGVLLAIFVRGTRGWFTLIASGFLGYGIARLVDRAGERNRATAFRVGAIAFAVVSVEVAWLLLGRALPGGLHVLTYLAAAYGAWVVYR